MPGTIDLVGPKGYVHGWRYVGGPGLPSRTEHTRLGGVEARQRRSGLWGGKTAAEHEAAVGKLSDDQRAIYNHDQENGKPLAAALAHAQGRSIPHARGRGSASPGYRVRHEGMGTFGVYRKSDGQRVGGVSSLGGGSHIAYREGVPGTTGHGSLTDAVKHMAVADRAANRLPKPPALLNTPNMKLAIRAGLLSADNRLGISDKTGRRSMGYANRQAAIELVGPKGWSHGWVRAIAGDMLSAAAKNPANAGTLRDIASTMSGIASAEATQGLPKGAAKILAGVTPGNATAMVQRLHDEHGMDMMSAAKLVAQQLNKTPGGVTAAQKALAARQTIQSSNQLAALDLASPTSAAGRKGLAARNLALPDGSFPVPNGAYWDKARDAIGRVADPAKRAAVARLLRRTAPRFGKGAALKNSWAAPGGSKHSNTGPAMEFAMPTNQPIRTPSDLLIGRGEGGVAIIRHRMGGAEIGTIRREGRGWRASVGGKDLSPRNHQRTALADVIGTHNAGAATPEHRPATSAGSALQPPAQQTPLMAQYGIPAVRALATPTTGTDDGPRVTGNDPDDGKSSGLTPKGVMIKKKLLAKGWPDARADQFARRAQNMGK